MRQSTLFSGRFQLQLLLPPGTEINSTTLSMRSPCRRGWIKFKIASGFWLLGRRKIESAQAIAPLCLAQDVGMGLSLAGPEPCAWKR
jgi:hypothetical protein